MEETGILENPALLSLVLPHFEPGRNVARFPGFQAFVHWCTWPRRAGERAGPERVGNVAGGTHENRDRYEILAVGELFARHTGELRFLAAGELFGHREPSHGWPMPPHVLLAPLAVLSPGPRLAGTPSRGKEVTKSRKRLLHI